MQNNKVLIVDDEPDRMKLMSTWFAYIRGYEVVLERSGPAAKKRLELGERFSLAISAFEMRHVSGKEIADQVKSLDPYAKTLLVTSAHPSLLCELSHCKSVDGLITVDDFVSREGGWAQKISACLPKFQ